MISWALLACVFTFSPLFAEQNLYEIVKPGMSLKSFNKIKEIPLKVRAQKAKAMLTSYGVGREQTAIQSKYFNFKKPEEWQGGIVRYQNNQIEQFSLFNKKASSLETGNLLRKLMGGFEEKPTYHPFRSFGKEGICISWNKENVVYNFNCTKDRNNWSHQIDVRKNGKFTRSLLEPSSSKVISLLDDLGIKGGSETQSVASQDSDDDLLDLLQ